MAAKVIPVLQPIAPPMFRPLYTQALTGGPECLWVFENLDKLLAWYESTGRVSEDKPGDPCKFSDFCTTQFELQQVVERERQEPHSAFTEFDAEDDNALDDDDEVPW